MGKIILSYKQFGMMMDKLVYKIKKSGKKYDCILTIPNGGFPVATHLAKYLEIPKIISSHQVKTSDQIAINHISNTLVVDDLIDTGVTMFELKQSYRIEDIAVLYFKPEKIKHDIIPTYFVEETSDWVVFPWEKEEEIPNREGYDNKIRAYFDGACKGNPGPGSYGYVITENGKENVTDTLNISHITNNVAEYYALILLLNYLVKNNINEVEIFGDSSLVINQVNGKWKVKAEHLKPLATQAKYLVSQISNCTISWISRDDNDIVNNLIGGKQG